ncbi:probable mitochondrial import inner membrane translocase subunit TIM21 [Ziziphus jujuba]|uniref:Mitochondrial import inner membrane translocase subunit Tim21 n=1 Tax=Ziziphus jujuba TaxID=326968 RepID=A0A6P4A8C1_ZIZJJ|nr:probable mitochondrial import inner membrane translocase subunit TIM21 [Ziziphus jujuba]
MGSCKCALELWRKKQVDVVRILPRLRWLECRSYHSAQVKPDKLLAALEPRFGMQYHANTNHIIKGILRANGVLFRRPYAGGMVRSWPPSQLMKNYGASPVISVYARAMSSQASKQPGQNETENKKEVSTVEDPFDAPTYNIPEKPVTFAEGASYSLIILLGLGIAVAAGYAVFKELIFEPKEYKIFGKALKRIQDDAEVRVRIGHPITGYGQETRNRAARQRIPNRVWTDEEGVEHVEVNFHIRGPHGAGKVFSEMYKDQEDRQWKYTYLIVQITSPSPTQLILESYLPAYSPA